MTHTINLSNGHSYVARLVVLRDHTTEGRGRWRLFWNEPGTSRGVYEQSTVTGQPFFRTMRDAVAYGQKRYGETAVREDW
jgi:hypothetical protein